MPGLPTAPGDDPSPGERGAVRPGGRRRHGGAPPTGAGHRRGPGRRRPRPRHHRVRRLRAGGRTGPTLEGRGFPFTLLPGRGIVRSLAPGPWPQPRAPWPGWPWPPARALGVVARARPRVVVSVGGYASLPASLAAVVLGCPLVLVNVDAVPGAANRLFGRLRPGQRGGLGGQPAAPGRGHRHPGAPRDRRRPPRPRADRRAARAAARACRRTGPRGRVRGVARGPPHQRGRRRPGRPLGGPGRPVHLPHRRPAGLGGGVGATARRRPGPAGAGRRPPPGPGALRGPDGPASTPPPTWWCAGPGP